MTTGHLAGAAAFGPTNLIATASGGWCVSGSNRIYWQNALPSTVAVGWAIGVAVDNVAYIPAGNRITALGQDSFGYYADLNVSAIGTLLAQTGGTTTLTNGSNQLVIGAASLAIGQQIAYSLSVGIQPAASVFVSGLTAAAKVIAPDRVQVTFAQAPIFPAVAQLKYLPDDPFHASELARFGDALFDDEGFAGFAPYTGGLPAMWTVNPPAILPNAAAL